MLHIADGESVAGTLRESGIPGTVSVYGDLMYEGPAPAGRTDSEWLDVRAGFMADAGYAAPAEARRYLEACQDALAAYPRHEEVVVWLDNKLSNQLILIKVLDWFSRRDMGNTRLSLVDIGSFPGSEPFAGLGALTGPQLASLLDIREPVGEAHYRTARAAWNAFTSPDPTDIERFRAADAATLPFLADALKRHLEQFPSFQGGLSRTERQALTVLEERGPLRGAELFVAAARLEEQVFMGDVSFYRIAAGLARADHPLVHVSGSVRDGLGTVSLMEAGRSVLDGRSDHIHLNGIDRWLGGVHLDGARVWRWNQADGLLILRS